MKFIEIFVIIPIFHAIRALLISIMTIRRSMVGDLEAEITPPKVTLSSPSYRRAHRRRLPGNVGDQANDVTKNETAPSSARGRIARVERLWNSVAEPSGYDTIDGNNIISHGLDDLVKDGQVGASISHAFIDKDAAVQVDMDDLVD